MSAAAFIERFSCQGCGVEKFDRGAALGASLLLQYLG